MSDEMAATNAFLREGSLDIASLTTSTKARFFAGGIMVGILEDKCKSSYA